MPTRSVFRKGPRVVAAVAALFVLAAGGAQAATPNENGAGNDLNQSGKLASLGAPMKSVRSVGGNVGIGLDGRPETYTVAARDNDMGVFYVLDSETGSVKEKFDLGRGTSSYAVEVAPDKSVYVATTGSGRLYRWVPWTKEFKDLGKVLPTESHIYRMTFDDKGNLYGGTYPNGKLFRYDTSTGKVHDYGSVDPGQSYIRSVAYHDDMLYVGGTFEAYLAKVNAKTGERTKIDFPPGTDLDRRTYDVDVVGDKLFVRLSKTGLIGTLYVRDLNTGKWIGEFDKVSGLEVSKESVDGKVYFSRNGALSSYDLNSGEVKATPLKFQHTAQLRSLGLGTFHNSEVPGQSVLGMLWTGEAFWYNPTTGKSKIYQAKMEKNPVRMRSLTEGPNNTVLTGGTGDGAFGMVDPETGNGDVHEISEVMGMLTVDDQIYLGNYPNGRVHHYDPGKPWKWANIDPEAGKVNPKEIYSGVESKGDRPFDMVDIGDGRIAIGTVNKSGYLGGSLIIHDTNTGKNTEYTNPVPEQSIMSLEYRDGVLYMGTSVYGGYGADETQSEAKLVAWDVAAGKELWETTPLPGEKTISELTFDPNGKLLGLTAGVMFEANPSDGSVVRQHRYADYEWPIDGAYALGDVEFNDKDGKLYATVPNRGLLRIDPKTWQETVITDRSVYRMFVHSNGDVFTNDGAELLRYRPA